MILKKPINSYVTSIKKYYSYIEDDIFIDYICFFLDKDETICLTVDSSGENISIISFKDMNDCIKRTGIYYDIKEVGKDFFLKEIEYDSDEYEQLGIVFFIFENKVLKITIGMDSLELSF